MKLTFIGAAHEVTGSCHCISVAEQEYLNKFEQKKYMPELLFEDAEIVERVKNHPMALWKCKE